MAGPMSDLRGDCLIMEANLNVQLTSEQRALVLEGLRFVRSSRKLAFRDPLAPPDAQSESDLQAVTALMERLHGQPAEKAQAHG